MVRPSVELDAEHKPPMVVEHCPKCDAVLVRRPRDEVAGAPDLRLVPPSDSHDQSVSTPRSAAFAAHPGTSAPLLIDQMRARLAEVDRQLAQVAALKTERKQLLAMIRISERTAK